MEHKPRRIVTAVVMLLVAFGGGVAALGSDEAPHGQDLLLGRVVPGDAGTYYGHWDSTGDVFSVFDFELRREGFLDARGNGRVDVVHYVAAYDFESSPEDDMWVWSPSKTVRAAVDGAVILRQTTAIREAPEVRDENTGLAQRRIAGTEDHMWQYDSQGPLAYPSCLLVAPGDGSRLAFKSQVLYQEPCDAVHVPMPGTDVEAPHFERPSTLELPSLSGARFEPAEGDKQHHVYTHRADGIQVTLWYEAGHVYPAKIHYAWKEHELVLWHVPDDAADAFDAVAPRGAPGFDMRPVAPYGFEPGQWNGWNAEEAWQVASALPEYRSWAASHPDAGFLAIEQHLSFDHESDNRTDFWSWDLGDGEDAIRLATKKVQTRVVGVPGQAPVYAPDPLNPDGTAEMQVIDGKGIYPIPIERLPTVSSATRRHDAFADWGFINGLVLNASCTRCAGETATLRTYYDGGTNGWHVDPDVPAFVTSHEDMLSSRTFLLDGRVLGGIDVVAYERDAYHTPVEFVDPHYPTYEVNHPPKWSMPSFVAAGAVGVLAGLLAILYYFFPALKSGAVGLFTRLRPDQILENPTRQQIMDVLHEQPGMHQSELQRVTGAGNGTLDHHLRKLVDAGKIRRHEAAGYTCYFPHHFDRRLVAVAPVLRSETARDILQAISRSPGTVGGQVAEAIGVNRATVSHHVKRLVEAGVVEADREGRSIHLRLTGVGRMALDAGFGA